MNKLQCKLFTGEWENNLFMQVLLGFCDKGYKIDEKDIEKILPKVLESTPDDLAKILMNYLKKNTSRILKEHRADANYFCKMLNSRWKTPINLLELLLIVAIDAGNVFNDELRPKAESNCDYSFDILTRLQGRACQVAGEIISLIKAGYADGANARWRTLHEIAVVSFIISSFGKIVSEKYLDHEVIESYKAMLEYNKYASGIGCEPISDDEMKELTNIKNQLCEKYGNSFSSQYGWAAEITQKKKPTFNDLEILVNIDHLKPYYRMASHSVHANPKGIKFKLSLIPNNSEIILAGPGDTGFADPGHCAAISLYQITTSLLCTNPTIIAMGTLKFMGNLVDEIGEAFLEVQKGLEEESNME
jgi:hypothetical protein